jgi:hypothetical protein
MQSIIQILKLHEPKAWSIDGRSGFSHKAEGLLLNPDGSLDCVGVLKIRGEELIKKAQLGTYVCSFAMRANPASREFEAVLTDLQPVKKAGAGFVPVDAPTTSAAPAKV